MTPPPLSSAEQKNSAVFPLFLTLVFFTFLGYSTLLPHGFYTLDDYLTIDFGYADSLWGSIKETTRFMAEEQHRFQPVRLTVFVLTTHLLPEEWSVFLSLLLHLAIIYLFFTLFRRFNVSPLFLLAVATYFTLFGRWRVMNGLSAMTGGSELMIFLFLLTALFLVKAVENRGKKRMLFYSISVMSYLLMMLSYEIAVPLLLPLCGFYLLSRFVWEKGAESVPLTAWSLLPYLLIASSYVAGTTLLLPREAGYTGTDIQLGAETIQRLITNLRWNFTFQVRLSDMMPRPEWALFLPCYFLLVFRYRSQEAVIPGEKQREQKKGIKTVLLFSFILYPSLLVLFTISGWGTPDIFMVHHAYEMTFGSSILTVALLFFLTGCFGKKAERLLTFILVYLLLPLLFLAGLNFNLQFGESQKNRTELLQTLKDGLLQKEAELEGKDTVLLMNIPPPFAEVSSFDGALAKWFNFRKKFSTGQQIVAVQGDTVRYLSPLSYYDTRKERRVKNRKMAIFSVDEKGFPRSYHDVVNLDRAENSFQVHCAGRKGAVYSEGCSELQVILKRDEDKKVDALFLGLREHFLRFSEKIALQINGRPVNYRTFLPQPGGHSVIIPLSSEEQEYSYFFLTFESDEKSLHSLRNFRLITTDGKLKKGI